MPDLAVIMSIYQNDRLEFVKQSVQSILNQTFTQFHYYLALDGPVKEEVDKYVSNINDERLRLYRIEKNGGLAAALNFLLEKVLTDKQYKFIARMDADDISIPARFEKQRNYLLENSDITVLGSWYEEIDEEGKHLLYRKLPFDHESLRKRFYTRTPFVHPSVMFNRNLIEIAGNYPTDTHLMEDNVLWGKALIRGLIFSNIQDYLIKYRIDKSFYKRRSGIRYGWNYIITRLKIANTHEFGLYYIALSLVIGFAKMLPVYFLRPLYQVAR